MEELLARAIGAKARAEALDHLAGVTEPLGPGGAILARQWREEAEVHRRLASALAETLARMTSPPEVRS